MTNQTITHSESRIFEGFRALGHVSNAIPCITRYIHRRRENFIVSCIGKSFNTYASQQLKLLSVSGTHSTDITCMSADSYHIYTGAEGKVFAWRRGTELKHTYGESGEDVIAILSFGTNVLALDKGGYFRMWNIVSEELQLELKLNDEPTILMHPATYLNKVLIGFKNGTMQLWNIHTLDIIYTFQGFGSTINAIVQAPAVDVVAVSLPDKQSIALHNLKLDHTLFVLKCEERISCLGFRTDNVPVLVAGTENGSLFMWDLERQEMVSHVEGAHQAPVGSIQTFPQEPMFVTSSADNSIKVWIFDMPDGSFRLYNSREGHSKSPNRVRFHGTKGYHILSAGLDSKFLIFHIYNETYNRSLGKTKISFNKSKMQKDFSINDGSYVPKIVDFTTESVANPKHHEDIAACHEGQTGLSTWSFNNTKRGDKVLILSKYKKTSRVGISAMCLCLTSCGQFVIAGYDNGTVERFNIQSGIHRKTYGAPAHIGTVRGVSVDKVNSVVMSGGADGVLKFWDFTTGEKFSALNFPAGISFFFSHRSSGLLGVGLDNYSVIIVNTAIPAVFRRFTEMCSSVLDACFSPDCRFVTASTSDCLIRTWDLPTSNLVDIFRLESIAKSMDYSPNGEFLVTSLHDSVGILLWMNKTVFAHVSLMPIPPDFEPPLISVPEIQHDADEEEIYQEYTSPDQLNENLITLSLLPESRWKNLLNLDIIKMRNRPKQPPKNYEAPFFLSGLTAQSNAVDGLPDDSMLLDDKKDNAVDLKPVTSIIPLSKFVVKLLQPEKTSSNYEDLCVMLGNMPPTDIENELRSLAPVGDESVTSLKEFLIFLHQIFSTNRFYEASQAYLALFLKIHADTIRGNDELKVLLQDFSRTLESRDSQLIEQINSILAFSSFLKSTLF
ncbi:unnamed protein product [Allacma fusca]|uniref:WD repeat-containing protein 36 n=1 Tax=Allacma fusca TaxID=39272 RepID=A0A8J2KZ07_9HEXA|nr:unnamed protein product [Allacma fusca]